MLWARKIKTRRTEAQPLSSRKSESGVHDSGAQEGCTGTIELWGALRCTARDATRERSQGAAAVSTTLAAVLAGSRVLPPVRPARCSSLLGLGRAVGVGGLRRAVVVFVCCELGTAASSALCGRAGRRPELDRYHPAMSPCHLLHHSPIEPENRQRTESRACS